MIQIKQAICENKVLVLNCDYYIVIFETIYLCARKISGSFNNVIYKMCFKIIYTFDIYMYKEDLALDNL